MGDPRDFLRHPRKDPGHRPVEERLRDFEEVELRLSEEEVRRQAARCMDCGIPFCHGCGCPVENVIPEINALVESGRWRDALEVLRETNDFPEFTGRVCPALCEASCVNGIDGEPVTIREIELAVIEKAFEQGYIRPEPPAVRVGRRVAVVGSGPAGLAVANALNKRGYDVVVYDAARKPGGILRYGIPDFKLEKRVVDRRIELMEAEGVSFEMGVRVGEDVSYRYMKDRFDAVCLTAGAREPRDLKVPGRELGGIHFAMEYLTEQNMRLGGEAVDPARAITAKGKAVAIIGGGDTGSDCLGTALRQGAIRVCQLEILPEPPPERAASTPWPMWPLMLRESSSHKEGGERLWSVSVKEFLGEGGRVLGLRAVRVEWEGAAPREKPGTEFELPAGLVLLAMGFVGFKENPLVEGLGIAADSRGRMVRDESGMTCVDGIFVAGDMAVGASLVVRAIADGRRVAESIARYLSQEG